MAFIDAKKQYFHSCNFFNIMIISKNGVNKSFTPTQSHYRRSIVTHALRKTEVSSLPRHLSARMAPGEVEFALACPAGYYLIADQKICAVCPADTSSPAGENTCYACAPGTRSEPGAARCRLALKQLPWYHWWLYPPCGYVIACVGVVCACVMCVTCACVSHGASPRGPAAVGPARTESRWAWGRFRTATCTSSVQAVSGRKPLSPSRVILAKFFRLSPRSSRVSDDQESKFEQWKRSRPPSLPPIDFDNYD